MNEGHLFDKDLQTLTVHKDSKVLSNTLTSIATASIEIWKNLALGNNAGSDDTSSVNNFGEATKNIDIHAVRVISENARQYNNAIWLVTEEDTTISRPQNCAYALFVDPIDGSKHVRYQSECGTFFSLVSMKSVAPNEPIVSGYALYGYMLTLVIALDKRLVITTYNPKNHQFRVTDTAYKMPLHGNIYSINDADINNFPPHDYAFVQNLREKHYTSRYNGVLVADLHRIVIEGGIFISPRLKSGKVKAKKYFEALAVEHIMQASGGRSVNSYPIGQHLTEAAQQDELFSSVPLVFGSRTEIDNYMKVENK